MALLWIVPGCGRRAEPQGGDAVVAEHQEKPARVDGVVMAADRQLPVAPFVMHDPHLDLFVRCQMKRDAAQREGETVPLCFDPERRATAGLKTLRVEKAAGDMGGVLRRLTATDEGAHFVVEKTGTPHQVLNLAYAARRDGAVRPNELRLVTCHDEAWKKLAAELTRLYPGLRTEVTDLPPLPAQKPPTPAPGGTTP